MPRRVETIVAIGSTLAATPVAFSFGDGATAARNSVLSQLYRMRLASLADRSLDFGPRQTPFDPFNNHDAESLLLKLRGTLPEPTQYSAAYIGFVLNLLSVYGNFRSNHNSLTSNIPVLGPLRPFADVIATFSLAIAPNMLLMMIEQYKYLLTATHLGATEAVMTFIPALLMLPAILKLPSVAEGAFHAINDVILRPIAGAVRGIQNTKRRGERQRVLKPQLAERKKTERNARLHPHFSSALETQRKARQAAEDIQAVLGPPAYTTDQRIADIENLPTDTGINPTRVVLGTINHPVRPPNMRPQLKKQMRYRNNHSL